METIRQVGEAINQSLQAEHAEHAMDQPPIRVIFEAINSAEFAKIYAELAPVSDRPGLGILDVISLWRHRVGQMEGTRRLQFSGTEEIGGGFKIKLVSRDRAVLKLAIQEAAISRFQAIFLTTATTVAGLMPLLSETSEQAQYLIPAAASLAYGELFSTVLMYCWCLF